MTDKPKVTVSKASGVSSVSPGEILRSRAGQAELRKTLNSGMYAKRSASSGKFLDVGAKKK